MAAHAPTFTATPAQEAFINAAVEGAATGRYHVLGYGGGIRGGKTWGGIAVLLVLLRLYPGSKRRHRAQGPADAPAQHDPVDRAPPPDRGPLPRAAQPEHVELPVRERVGADPVPGERRGRTPTSTGGRGSR
jgi:hypothetical protein